MKQRLFVALLAAGFLSAGAAGPSGSTMYGFMSYEDSENFVGGWYEVEPSGAATRLWTYEYGEMGAMLSNGWMRNGRLCGLCTLTFGSEDLLGAYAYQELNPSTGEVALSRVIEMEESYVPYFVSAAYISAEDRIYGFGRGEDHLADEYYFKSAPAASPEEAEIVALLDHASSRCYSLCYSIADGCLYGVNTRGQLVSILTDGTITELFELPVADLSNQKGALAVSPYDGCLLWNPGTYESGSPLYAIYPSEERVELLHKYADDSSFTFFLTPDGPTDPSGPAAATVKSVDFEGPALKGTLSFTLPVSAMNASPLEGTLDWTLLDNGKAIASGSGRPGEELTLDVETEQGEHTLRLDTRQGDKEGYPCAVKRYTGNDSPQRPAGVTLTAEKVSWEAVTAGAHGGYVEPADITYTVSINGEPQGETSATELALTIDPDRIQDIYRAEVRARFAGLSSEPGISDKCVIGRPYPLPLTIAPTQHDWEMSTTINNDGSPWYGEWRLMNYLGEYCFASGWSKEQADDWLILPAAEFTDNSVVYEVTVEAFRSEYYALEYFEVWAGDAPTVEAMTIPVIPKTRPLKYTSRKDYSGKFAVPKAGKYYVAVRGCSAPDQADVMVKNIRIRATEETAAVPASVSGLTIVGSSDADLTATVSFTLPSAYIDGEPIPAEKEVAVKVACAETLTLSGHPGEQLMVTVATLQGDNYITVTPVADGIEGTPSEVSLFTGMDYLSYCEDFNGEVSADNMSIRLTWRAPEGSLEGGYVSDKNIEYMIAPISSVGEFLEEPVSAGIDVTEYTYVLPAGAPQEYLRIGIAAKNAAGISPARSFVGRVLGTPYTLPIVERFENMQQTFKPLQASKPSAKYTDGAWTWCQPGLVDPSFETPDVEFAVIGYTDSSNAWVRMGLPKVSTAGLSNAHVLFRLWNGEGTATQKGVYGLLHGMTVPEKIADIPDGEGWQDVAVEFPARYLGKEWVSLYIDGHLPTSTDYLILGGYSILPTSSVSLPAGGSLSIVREGARLLISNPDEEELAVTSASGVLLYQGRAASAEVSLPSPGVYVVGAGGRSYKIVY